MQELQDPWTHWFPQRPAGRPHAHGTTSEHGTGGGLRRHSRHPHHQVRRPSARGPRDRSGLRQGQQPNSSTRGDRGRDQGSPRAAARVNIPSGKSGRGSAPSTRRSPASHPGAVPDVRSPTRTSSSSRPTSTRSSRQGRRTTIDIRRVFLDEALGGTTVLPENGASGRRSSSDLRPVPQPKLDQTITRAKFDVTKLDTMTRAEKQLAIDRMKMGSANRLHMPPSNMRNLPDDAPGRHRLSVQVARAARLRRRHI